ncbi:MAG: glycosyltransferase family 39 protein [Thermoleophilaceae bacterium]|nr:glycosyltransferase family 39 protein [Thermoleophilaceae bacterium]
MYFHFTSLQVAHGHSFSDAFASTPTGDPSPNAAHPPVYTLALAGVARIGLQSPDAQRIVGVLAGTVTVVLAGLIGGRLDGRRTAILAAGLCAASPAFVATDTALMSESLFGALVAGCVLLGLAIADRPSVRLGAALGLLIGLAGLTRGEGLLLLALIGIPVAAAAGSRGDCPCCS